MKYGLQGKRLRQAGKQRVFVQEISLVLFFLFGVLLGYTYVRCSRDMIGDELALYLENYLQLEETFPSGSSVLLQTLVCYFRTASCIFLLGFSFAGVLLIPLLCALQGFFFSFSLCSFALALGRDDFLVLLFLFVLRFLLLPCTFVLAAAALNKSFELAALSMGKGKRAQPICYEPAYWFRFFTAAVILFVAAVAEVWILPRVLRLLLH